MSHRLLIIDDDADVVRYLSRRLALAGYEILTAGDGILGEEVARASLPAVILLDMQMPRRDGMATLTALRRAPETSRTPVLMLSGVGAGGDAALAAGASDVLLKPCRHSDLVGAIERVLAQHSGSTTSAAQDPRIDVANSVSR